MRARDEINRFFIDQDQRRFALEAVQKRRAALDQEPLTQQPLQIEIVPSSAASAPTLIGQPGCVAEKSDERVWPIYFDA